MTVMMLAVDPDAEHREWVRAFEWHLDIVPELVDQLLTMTLPSIPAARFDKDRVTGGGYYDNVGLHAFEVSDEGTIVNVGATRDATDLWSWLTGYTGAVSAWLNQGVTAPWAADLPPVVTGQRIDAEPRSARSTALLTIGWLIDRAEPISQVRELETLRDAMFHLIRQLRGRYGVHRRPRRRRPHLCQVCGDRAVVIDWVDGENGSPKPIQAGKCKTCGQIYREREAS